MQIVDFTLKLLGLSEAIVKWKGSLDELVRADRMRAAGYCEAIADTLARAGEALGRLAEQPADKTARRDLPRELGRMKGYLDDLSELLTDRIDGRKLAGMKRRLSGIFEDGGPDAGAMKADDKRTARLAEAEGYFRALADGVRV